MMLFQKEARFPFIAIVTSAFTFLHSPHENLLKTYYVGPFGLTLRQQFQFEELAPCGCRVTVRSRLKVPRILAFLQPSFKKPMLRWFWSVWEEDKPMRERRLKVWQSGFKDLVGMDYVNNKTAAPAQADSERPYAVTLPVPKISEIARGGIARPFRVSEERGYGLPDLPRHDPVETQPVPHSTADQFSGSAI